MNTHHVCVYVYIKQLNCMARRYMKTAAASTHVAPYRPASHIDSHEQRDTPLTALCAGMGEQAPIANAVV